jgi:queuosine precursor transporter
MIPFLAQKKFLYLDSISVYFVTILLVSNIASSKFVNLGLFTFDGGTILFPLSYIFGDILTEVYGYKTNRRVIWLGFFSLIIMSAILYIVQILPPASDWRNQQAYELILGITPRIVAGSLLGFFCGEFSNSYILAKMKIWTKGKWLWTRTIGSTVVGEAVDTIVFATVAFAGLCSMDFFVALVVSNYLFKVGIEVLCTPVTYRAVRFLKKKEQMDTYDQKTNFNPFHIDDDKS